MNTKEKLSYFLIYFIILAVCIQGLYYIIRKITKLHKEDNKKNIGKIFALVIAILLIFGISLILFVNMINILKKFY